ncbi:MULTISPECIES: hypothetical protein [Spirosoma]|uniref:DUF975 family protein n=1 Tax=Spirosoma sordidisoli TaxID=2502893 RepID=A0A4Q2UXP9_9BACT|nr:MULTISPECIES: hypothetical protein [Spirosoma]RYC71839.1 hypothetical protein EQG79_06845 [Spirosoma sordidisoli]
MNAFFLSLRHLLRSTRLIGLLYGITLVLGLLVALPFYSTLQAEDQDSRAFLNLLDGFDYTVYADFMQRSERVIDPLLSVGRWLGVLFVFLSVFLAGGILNTFAQPSRRFDAGLFWQVCTAYFGRFLQLLGVTTLFLLVGAGLWLIAGLLVGIVLSDTLTERGLFWVGLGFFSLFALTATLLFCIGDYAKVIMFRDDESNAFRAFGRAGRLVMRNLPRTYGLYWLFIGIGTALFGLYFLIDELIPMRNTPTILLMFLVQQALVLARTALKAWALGTAYQVYLTLPAPIRAMPPNQPDMTLIQPDRPDTY